MEFTRYHKISNYANFGYSRELVEGDWIVTEKVHGANFSFHTDGKTVQVAKRSGILDGTENFFNHQDAEFMKTYPEKMKNVFTSVTQVLNGKDIAQISVYGELFGGKYIIDGKDITPEGVKAIQEEVQYSPNLHWIAFDIFYVLKEEIKHQKNGRRNDYMDTDLAMKIFEEHDIFHLKPLFVGKMKEAMAYNHIFESTLPGILDLPPLPTGTNMAEGIVVRPLKNLRNPKGGRCRLKIKRQEFLEKSGWTPKVNNGHPKKKASLLSEIMRYATPQRLTNAISKIGHPSPENRDETVEEFFTDIFEDIRESEAELYELWLNETDKDRIEDIIRKKAYSLLRNS